VIAPGRRCSTVGCGHPATGPRGTCEAHGKAAIQTDNRRKGSAAAQGYGARWRHYRAWYLEQYPACGDRSPLAPNTTDSLCQRERRLVPAALVDHIVPIRGPNDPNFFDEGNHQSLCSSCHNRKRQREARAGRALELEGEAL
jgi:5-methylcytosine-specific restriction enzyme A